MGFSRAEVVLAELQAGFRKGGMVLAGPQGGWGKSGRGLADPQRVVRIRGVRLAGLSSEGIWEGRARLSSARRSDVRVVWRRAGTDAPYRGGDWNQETMGPRVRRRRGPEHTLNDGLPHSSDLWLMVGFLASVGGGVKAGERGFRELLEARAGASVCGVSGRQSSCLPAASTVSPRPHG